MKFCREVKPFCKDNGVISIHLHQNGRRKSHTIAHLVASAFIPNPKNKPKVQHINGNKTDNRVENLRWATHEELYSEY